MKFRAKKPEGEGGATFLKLKDGESIKGVFRGDPFDFQSHWKGGSVACTGADCDFCAKGEEPSFRFRINFVVKENGAYVAKLWEQGWRVYESLQGLDASGYNLEETPVQISRRGSDKNNTTYNVLPVPNAALTEEHLAALKAVKLHDPCPRPPKEEKKESDNFL